MLSLPRAIWRLLVMGIHLIAGTHNLNVFIASSVHLVAFIEIPELINILFVLEGNNGCDNRKYGSHNAQHDIDHFHLSLLPFW